MRVAAQRPPGCCRSAVYPGRRLKRQSHRRLISLQVDVVGHVLVNGLNDRRRRILADGIQDVSERLGQSFGTQHGQPLLQRLPAHIVETDQFERRRVNRRARRCLRLLDGQVAAQSCTRVDDPRRLSYRRLISLQVDVVGHVLVNRRRILADGIQGLRLASRRASPVRAEPLVRQTKFALQSAFTAPSLKPLESFSKASLFASLVEICSSKRVAPS